MLRPFDELMRQAILDGTSLALDDQVRFQPPDAQLVTDVQALNQLVLDVYLVDVRQNRRLRSNGRQRVNLNGTTMIDRAPERIDCHYVATAWSPVQPAPGLEPTLDEHALLYEVIAALLPAGVLNPGAVYAPLDPRLAAWPADFRDADLPFQVLSVEGFPKLSEFWTTMGPTARWKPALHLIATLPVALVRTVAGPPVTTSITYFQQDAVTETAETWINIGGHVRRTVGAGAEEVGGAWVRIESIAGAPLMGVTADAAGRFRFERLRPDQYQLRAGAPGLGPITRVVDVPSETGEYDLQFP